MTQPIKIMLVEDHQITRIGLRFSLEKVVGFTIVAEAADGSTAVRKALEVRPAVILMDIGLPRLSGIDAAREIKSQAPECRILMLTSSETDEDVLAALAAKCDGYCLKDVGSDQLVTAIRAVNGGGIWLDPAIAKRVIKSYVQNQSASAPKAVPAVALSDRELEVLALVVEGLTNQEIAEKLVVSTETVKTHMRHLMEKLAVSDRTQAAVKALRNGLI